MHVLLLLFKTAILSLSHFAAPGSLQSFTTKVAHVLPVSDDGGSTAEIVRVLGGPAVGDIRSRCLRLADASNTEVQPGTWIRFNTAAVTLLSRACQHGLVPALNNLTMVCCQCGNLHTFRNALLAVDSGDPSDFACCVNAVLHLLS